MTDTMTTTTVERVDPLFSASEQLALAGFLAGYSGLTRDAYALDLCQFVVWCREHGLALFAVRRADIESFGRELEGRGKARATVARRLSTIVGFYRYAEEEGLIALSPGAHVRRPRGHGVPTPSAWTATSWGPCWSSPAWAIPGSTPWSPCWPSTPAHLRGPSGQDRGARDRARPPDPARPPQGRQDGPHPAGSPDGESRRPSRRRTGRGTDLRRRLRAAARPPRGRPHRPPCRSHRRHRQARHAPHAAPRLHRGSLQQKRRRKESPATRPWASLMAFDGPGSGMQRKSHVRSTCPTGSRRCSRALRLKGIGPPSGDARREVRSGCQQEVADAVHDGDGGPA